MKKIRHLLSLKDLSKGEVLDIISLSQKIKRSPERYKTKLKGKTLLMIFAKPSLRTHLSFKVAMNLLGGFGIFYHLSHSTLGKKESVKDFSKVISRYSDIVMARLYKHSTIEELAKYSDVPVINGLTDWYHPCQILGDLLTIKEQFRKFKIKIAYLGDANNNVTHSLILAANKLGFDLMISCPNKKEFLPNKEAIGNLNYKYEKDPIKAVKNADVIYTDSWMSYQVPKSQERKRAKALRKYQVNGKLFGLNKKARFMHCLPAKRGHEVTDEVMDSSRSVVYDQAENRMWSQMAVLLMLLGKS
jgi:ornithine carbamoyltransferase